MRTPLYVVDGIIHCGVTNMPGGVLRTATLVLTNATFPYVLQLGNKGWKQALKDDAALHKGPNARIGRSGAWASPKPSGWSITLRWNWSADRAAGREPPLVRPGETAVAE